MNGAEPPLADQRPPLPGPFDRWALFLDFDGTMVPIAATPRMVRWSPLLGGRIMDLQRRLDGALALVSGRAADDLARLIAPACVTIAGQHGLEWRDPRGGHVCHAERIRELVPVVDRIARFTGRHPGLELEDKGLTVALHYRRAPHLAESAYEFVDGLRGVLGAAYELQLGKTVVELKPAGYDKGTAVVELMATVPFRDRVPVFVGDDHPDEAAFAAVNARGGITVKVGAGRTAARCRVRSVSAVWQWLRAVLSTSG